MIADNDYGMLLLAVIGIITVFGVVVGVINVIAEEIIFGTDHGPVTAIVTVMLVTMLFFLMVGWL